MSYELMLYSFLLFTMSGVLALSLPQPPPREFTPVLLYIVIKWRIVSHILPFDLMMSVMGSTYMCILLWYSISYPERTMELAVCLGILSILIQ